jgi:hypothetical protein
LAAKDLAASREPSTLAAAREARDIVLERIPQRRTGQSPAAAG